MVNVNLISSLDKLKENGVNGAHITVHLALEYLNMTQDSILKEDIYPLSQREKSESQPVFKIPAFPGASVRLGKKRRTPIRYEGGWLLKTIKKLK
tara:strand:+ start:71 stop:355 length:285 start_codon:yes stop_codon:yes gene_type:complete